MLKIIVTGPECSGKTTLTKKISTFYQEPYIKEYARTYLEEHGATYTSDDFNIIAKRQFSLIESRKKNSKKFVLSDTGLVVLQVWAEAVYGSCPNWIKEELEAQSKDDYCYFLCRPDIPWVDDPLRTNEGSRDELFDKYLQVLDSYDLRYFVVEGKIVDRLKIAFDVIKMLMTS